MEQPTGGGVARGAGGPGRYFVRGSGLWPGTLEPRIYLVDICAERGNGRCSCEDFELRRLPALHRGEPGPHRCKHIERAREFELDACISLWNLRNGEAEDGP